MKARIEDSRAVARDIAVQFFESGHGENLEQMIELAESTVADMIHASITSALRTAHVQYIEAVKRCAE